MGTFVITVIFEGSGGKMEEEEFAHGLAQIFTEAPVLPGFADQFSRRVFWGRKNAVPAY